MFSIILYIYIHVLKEIVKVTNYKHYFHFNLYR